MFGAHLGAHFRDFPTVLGAHLGAQRVDLPDVLGAHLGAQRVSLPTVLGGQRIVLLPMLSLHLLHNRCRRLRHCRVHRRRHGLFQLGRR